MAKPRAVWAAAARASPDKVEAVLRKAFTLLMSLVQELTELMTSMPLGVCRRKRLVVGAAEERVVRARRVAAAVTFILLFFSLLFGLERMAFPEKAVDM